MSTATASEWREATRGEPCPVCAKPDWCSLTGPEGAIEAAVCMRVESDNVRANGGWHHKLRESQDWQRQTYHSNGYHRNNGAASNGTTTNGKSKGPTFWTADEAIADLEQRLGPTVGRWSYHNLDGDVVGVVLRFATADGKTIRPVSRDINGRWSQTGMPEPRPLYNLPELVDADLVFVVEGEQCCEAIRSIGLVPTTSPNGSKAPGKADWSPLAGKQLVILPDFDAAGDQYAANVRSLSPSTEVRIVKLHSHIDGSPMEEKGDVVDWIAGHGDTAEPALIAANLMAIVDAVEPEVTAADDPADSGPSPKGQPEQWPEPEPFDNEKLPICPVDAFPPVLREWILATAESTQTPPDMAAMQALTVISAAIGGKASCQVQPGYSEPTNIFTATLMAPGNRKSAVHAAAVTPLLDYEKELCEAAKFNVSVAASERRVYEKKLAALEKKVADGKATMTELREVVRWLDENEEPAMPQLVVDDSTVEALTIAMQRQGGVIASMSPEGGVFDTMSGSYGDKPNFDVFLKGHAGDLLKQGRVSRAPIYIEKPRLTCGYCLQPYHFENLSAKDDLRGRGLLARFLYSIPRSYIGDRSARTETVPEDVAKDYSNIVGMVCRMGAGDFVFSDGGVDAYREWFEEVEPQMRPDGNLTFDMKWSSKLVGATVRIAAILEAVNVVEQWNAPREVQRDTFEQAVKFARYLIPHARRALGLLSGDGAVAFGAEDVLDRLRKWKVAEPGLTQFKLRDLLQKCRKTYSREELAESLEELVAMGWLREVDTKRSNSREYFVHPKL